MSAKQFVLLVVTSLLAACASTPTFNTAGVDLKLTPEAVLAQSSTSLGQTALWGGTILRLQNLEDSTRIEILAYPLDSTQRPDPNNKPLGRFMIHQPGFLDPANYSQGRLISVLGQVGESQDAKIGDSSYIYPVIDAQQLKLWPEKKSNTQGHFSFGLGIRL
ncbi:MAG: outer membrane lipoprotein [Gammaproteobacteria bacterium]|jgi:outer membrane lipoprotein